MTAPRETMPPPDGPGAVRADDPGAARADGPGAARAGATHGRRRRWLRRALALLVVVAVMAVAAAAWWLQPQPLLPEARAAMASTPDVAFSEDHGWLVYRPVGAEPSVGLVLYPGGKVEPAAYGRTAQAIAAAGYLVVIVPMPLNLAVLGADRAADVLAAYPAVERWAIGGHSLGGAMAGQFADQHPQDVEAVAFWAAYPNGDLSDQPELLALSTYGSLDAGAERFGSDATRATLPAATRSLVIEGGNHEQMGDYTGQPNDPPATITRDAQQAIVQEETIALLARVAATAVDSVGPAPTVTPTPSSAP